METTYHFLTSLRFELFYALATLLEAEPRVHGAWQQAALAALPQPAHAAADELGRAAQFFAAWPDALREAGASSGPEFLKAIATIDLRTMQDRLLGGLIHSDALVRQLLDDQKTSFAKIVAKAPAAKREWLAFVGLFPFDASSPMGRAATLLRENPRAFREATAKLARGFWESSFAATWTRLMPALEAARAEKERLFASVGLADFAHAAMLKIEVDDAKHQIKAARGGYTLPLEQLAAGYFYPSLFNDRRYWSAYERDGGKTSEVHFPFFEPSLAPEIVTAKASAEPDFDPALICRALGDPTRWAIALLLARGTRTGTELAKELALTKATVSHHLATLRTAGLLEERAERGAVKIKLRREALASWSSLALRRLFNDQLARQTR